MTKNLTMRKMFCCMLMVILMITLIPAQPAEAAAKYYKAAEITAITSTISGDEMIIPEKLTYCQGLYFWMECLEECEGMYTRLWCSPDKTGKGAILLADGRDLQVEHVSDEPGYIPPQQIDFTILSNGTGVYFVMKDRQAWNGRLYYVMFDGRGLDQIAELPNLYETGRLINYYNGQVYYYAMWSDDILNYNYVIYSASVKTGNVYKRRTNAEPYRTTTKASTRYIAYTNKNYNSANYWKTYIYDCEEKTAECIGKAISLSVVDKKLYYGISREDGGVYIYKEALSGRGKRTRVVTLKNAAGLGNITSKYVYWYKYDNNNNHVYYRYNLETKKSSKISKDKFKDYDYTWY